MRGEHRAHRAVVVKEHSLDREEYSAAFRNRATVADFLKLTLFSLTLRCVLLVLFPAPYGNDGFGRIFFSDQLFLSHWLPLTQLIVQLGAQLSDGILPIRLLFALCGSLAAFGFYLYLRLFLDRGLAFLGGLLFSVSPLYLMLSLMPYQDVLFLGLFYASLALLLEDAPPLRSRWGSLLYGLASLTRYESWFLIPVLIVWKARVEGSGSRPSARVLGLLRATIFFAWAPLLWFVLSFLHWGRWGGFLFQTQDRSFYAWNPHVDGLWIVQYLGQMLYWIGLFGSPIVLFSAWAFLSWAFGGEKPGPALRLLLLFGGLVLVFFFFIIGKEHDTVFRFAMIPLSVVLVMTVVGMGKARDWMVRRRPAWFERLGPVVLVFLITALIVYAAVPLAGLDRSAEFQDPFLIAQHLDATVEPGQKVLVVANRSRDLSDAAPLAYQRLVAQSRLGRDRILAAGLLHDDDPTTLRKFARAEGVAYLVIFENFAPWLAADVFFGNLPRMQPDQVETILEVETATVYRVVFRSPNAAPLED